MRPNPLHAILGAVIAAALAWPARADAQQGNAGTITGIVQDSAARPVAGADVLARPGAHRTRTDSTGHFVLTGLDPDGYTVVARKLGFAPTDFDVKLGKGGRVDIKLVLGQRLPMLDTVVVSAGRDCSQYSLDGFVCRRHGAGGVFLDYTEIDDKEALYTADIFRNIPGFREDVRSTRNGPIRVATASVPWGCITSLVDGRPVTGANIIPEFPYDLLAMEIYAKPDSVPKEYQRYTWPRGDVTRSGRCSVVVYWTLRAKMKP